MWLRLLPWAAAAIGISAAGLMFWRLNVAHEELGAAQQAANAYAKALADKTAAQQGRAQTERAVRTMAPAEKLERLK